MSNLQFYNLILPSNHYTKIVCQYAKNANPKSGLKLYQFKQRQRLCLISFVFISETQL